MEVNTSPELREKVIAWVNSKEKNLSAGLELLRETCYKPHVCENFEKNKARKDIPAKLDAELRLFLRYYANPTAEIHKDEDLEDAEAVAVLGNIDKELLNEEYPVIIKQLLFHFSEMYKDRSIAHHSLKAVGEGNSVESVEKRRAIIHAIGMLSLRMDAYWAAMEEYKTNGTLPTEELFTAEYLPVVNVEAKTETAKFILAADVEGLKKQSDGWRVKILKAENRLNYQSDKKEAKEKPMPAGHKRIIVEKRIAQLTAEKLEIDMQIANLK